MRLNFKTYIKFKTLFSLQLFGGLCFCFLFFTAGQVQAIEETRTISNFILQDTATRTTGTQTDQTFTFVMTDEIVDVKNAFFDISGIAGAAGSVTLDLSLDDDKTDLLYNFNEAGITKSYTLDSTGGPTPFHLIYNVTNVMGASGNKCYVNSRGTRNCVISFKNTNASVYGLTIKLVVTYRFTKAASAAVEETRTISNFILQDTATRATGTQTDQTFTFVMTDEIVDVKNAFFDISGIAGAAGSVALDLSLDDDKSDLLYNFNEAGVAKSYTLDSTGGPTPFHLIYNVTNVMGVSGNKCYISTRGTYNCVLSFKNTGASVYALSIKSIVTYRFKPPSSGGNIPASGTYTSPTFDSKVASDDAGGTVSKSGFNTIRWIEDVSNATLVKSITIAANNDDVSWGNYYGGNGTSNETACETANTCYSRSNTTQSTDKLYCSSTSLGANRYEILCRIAPAQQNFRYFRYKIKLCNEKTSPSQCSGGNGNFTSKVEKVILNWSP